MNITATAVAVTLAVVIAVAFLFFGPNVFRPFQTGLAATSTPDTMATTTDDSMNITGDPRNTGGAPEGAAPSGAQQPLPTSLTVTDEVVGNGEAAKAGDTLTMNYVGMFPDGTVFDASAKHGQPFTFQLGAHQVIAGWDEGLVGMKVGGKRKLIIPPSLGYGSQANGPIPGNSTLIFEVELVKIGQ